MNYLNRTFEYDNIYLKVKFNTLCNIVETFNYSLLLWTFRPRKTWPEFFTWRVGVQLRNQVRNRDQNINNNIIRIQTAKVTNKLLFGPNTKANKSSFGSDKSFESFGSMDEKEPVLILNPNQFTVEDADFVDYGNDSLEEEKEDEEKEDQTYFKI